jgi:hypothetical protein
MCGPGPDASTCPNYVGTAAPRLSCSANSAASDGEGLLGLDGQDRATLPAFPLHSTAAPTSPQHLHSRGEFFACIRDKLSSRVQANTIQETVRVEMQ